MAAAYRCVDSCPMTVALGLFAAVGWAFVTLRLASVSRGLDPAVGMFVLLASSLVLTAPLGLALDGLPPADGRGLGAAAVAGLLEMTGFLCYLKAVQRGSMAVIAPLIGLEGGVAAVIAVIGGEAVSATLAVGIVMAALGASLACAAPVSAPRRAPGGRCSPACSSASCSRCSAPRTSSVRSTPSPSPG